jgi:hypothetical protein
MDKKFRLLKRKEKRSLRTHRRARTEKETASLMLRRHLIYLAETVT